MTCPMARVGLGVISQAFPTVHGELEVLKNISVEVDHGEFVCIKVFVTEQVITSFVELPLVLFSVYIEISTSGNPLVWLGEA